MSSSFFRYDRLCPFLPFLSELGIILRSMDGVVFLNKPAGITSFDAAAQCRRILKEKKIGHTGTLDPNASGLLIILTGKYTKLLPYCVSGPKAYRATFSLGQKTDTQDCWGTVTEEKTPSCHTQAELEQKAASLTGPSRQLPPMYSAVKVNGRKLYEYARKGIEVERKEREIFIYSLSVRQTGDNCYEMDAVVSSGTYIRTLICDYAALLGEYAAMTSLVRTGIAGISLNDAVTLEELREQPEVKDPAAVLDQAVRLVSCPDEKALYNGRDLDLQCDAQLAAVTVDGKIAAVYRKTDSGMYHCERGIF